MVMIPSNYEVNIAKAAGVLWNGDTRWVHFAKVELGQDFEENARVKFEELCIRFPSPEWRLTLSRVECFGKTLADSVRPNNS